MRIYKPEHVLAFWQEIYGELESKWHNKFFKHRSMKEILKHPSENIEVAFRRNKKLKDVLDDLRKQVELRIYLLTIHVCYPAEYIDRSSLQENIDVLLNPIAGETSIGLDYRSLVISSEFTSDFWDHVPELASRANEDVAGIWQQMIWEVEGEFEIPAGMSSIEAASSISWNLEFQYEFSDEEIEIGSYFFHILSSDFVEPN